MFHVISIGGATQDVFVRSDRAEVIRISDRQQEKAWLGFDYGAKIAVDALRFTVGGGATNTAVSFAKLGLQAACMVKVASDSAGDSVIENLKQSGVDSNYVVRSDSGQTGYSVILTSYEGERSILAYRGVNTQLRYAELHSEALQGTQWLYVSSLSGEADALLEPLFALAQQQGLRIAFNPGATQLRSSAERLQGLFAAVDLLFVNKEEAAQLTGLPLQKPLPEHLRPPTSEAEDTSPRPPFMYDLSAHLEALKAQLKGAVIITDGKRGTQAYDGHHMYAMPVYPTDVSDVLGAGDAFGSGCTAAHILGHDLPTALCWGSANASGVVTDPGAHNGLMNPEQIAEKIQAHPLVVPIRL